MSIKIEIEYSRRKQIAEIYCGDNEISLPYINGKPISDWFAPIDTGRVLWKGFIVELQDVVGSSDLEYEFISDRESESAFINCLKEHGVNIEEKSDTRGIQIDTTQTSSQYYETALSYENKNDFEMVKYLKLSAEQGNVDAQFKIAKCYEDGIGVEKDLFETFKCYKKLAEQGHIEAQFKLAKCYYDGDGVIKNYEAAVKWYTGAAELGYAKAQYNLGVCYDQGIGVEQDYKKAVEWYTKSAEQGVNRAQYNLGYCYYNGSGVEQDYKKAVEWYTKSAEQGYVKAQYNLGDCYYYRSGVERL